MAGSLRPADRVRLFRNRNQESRPGDVRGDAAAPVAGGCGGPGPDLEAAGWAPAEVSAR